MDSKKEHGIQVGDRVRRIITDNGPDTPVGSVGTVVNVTHSSVYVNWDGGKERQYCNPSYLEKVEKVATSGFEKGKWNEVIEKSRTYHYGDGRKYTVKGVTEVFVSPSHTHYLKTDSGNHIIRNNWIAVSFEGARTI